MLRTFLALPLADVFQEELKQGVAALKTLIDGVKWVRPETIHVTLHFFGATSEEDIPQIRKAGKKWAQQFQFIQVGLEGLGAFPSLRRPSVIWFAVNGMIEELRRLQGGIEGDLAKAGFPLEERTYRPHATIGRTRKGIRLDLTDRKEAGLKTEARKIQRMVLYKSKTAPGGSIYEIIEEFPFFKGPQAAAVRT